MTNNPPRRPLPNQILSWFNSGKDTVDIATAFRLKESEVVDLLLEARAAKPTFNRNPESPQRAIARMALANALRSRKPVTLPKVSLLAPTQEVRK